MATEIDVEEGEAPELFLDRTIESWEEYWEKQLTAEDKRNRDWRKLGEQITERYVDDRDAQGPVGPAGSEEFRVNLFNSNVTTVMGLLAVRPPEVDVVRRFDDTADDQARVASNIFHRMLNTSVKESGGGFKAVLKSILQDRLLPGLCQARVRYEFQSETIEHEAELDVDGNTLVEAYSEERLLSEDATIDYVHWKDFRWSYAKVWPEVFWLGFDVYMTKPEAVKRFGSRVANRLTYRTGQRDPNSYTTTENPYITDPDKTACICEIWNKEARAVFWYSLEDKFLCDMKEDPLGLPGFFPCPEPLVANLTTSLFKPVPDFIIAQDLYNEVDELSTRINIITKAVKVVGAYDKSTPELQNIFAGALENDMVGLDNWAMFAEKGGMRGVMSFYPVQDVVMTLDKLREMRAEAMALLNAVIGMPDILRGEGMKYEGVAGQRQRLKVGSVRVRDLETDFETFVSDLLTLKAQVISLHFAPETIVHQSNILRSMDAQLAIPAVALVKDTENVAWRVQVKPESMAMLDWAELKEDRTEYVNAVALFLQSAAPILTLMPESMPVLLELLKWGLAGFKGGREIESVLDQAIARIQQNPDMLKRREDQEGGKEAAQVRGKMALQQQKFQQDMAKQADKAQKELQKLLTQFRTRVAEIEAQTQADAIGEVVQADQNIREYRAKQGG